MLAAKTAADKKRLRAKIDAVKQKRVQQKRDAGLLLAGEASTPDGGGLGVGFSAIAARVDRDNAASRALLCTTTLSVRTPYVLDGKHHTM